jgi:hypothetical protein
MLEKQPLTCTNLPAKSQKTGFLSYPLNAYDVPRKISECFLFLHGYDIIRSSLLSQVLPVNPTHYKFLVSSQKVEATPCGCPLGQAQGLPLPRDIEKIRFLPAVESTQWPQPAKLERSQLIHFE